MNIKNRCFFTGHRKLPLYKINSIIKRLNQEIDNLLNQGITEFISGGAIGFDLIAASAIIAKKQMGKPIRLIFALPYRNHVARCLENEKILLRSLLMEADEIIYVSDEYNDDCIKLRTEYMVRRSAHCICALLYKRSATSQAVSFARKSGLNIINIAD